MGFNGPKIQAEDQYSCRPFCTYTKQKFFDKKFWLEHSLLPYPCHLNPIELMLNLLKHCIAARNVFCKILGFHSGDYEECRLLGCGAM
jgi:hypothetical protein